LLRAFRANHFKAPASAGAFLFMPVIARSEATKQSSHFDSLKVLSLAEGLDRHAAAPLAMTN
jgi:hypothetical protein